MLKEGELSWRKIAEKTGTTEDQVSLIAKQEKIRNPRLRTLTSASRQEVIKLLRQQQLSMAQISRKLDVSYHSVYRLAKEEDIPARVARPQKPTPQMEQETLRLLTQENQPREQVARQLGMSPESVRTIAEDHRVAETPAASVTNTQISPAVRQQITDLFHEGVLSQRQIASRVGVSRWTIGRMASDAGYAPSDLTGVTASQAASVFELHDQGKSMSEIADTLKLRPGRVRRILTHYNPQTNKKSWWDTTPEIRSKAIAQLDAGHARKQVAYDLGLPLETVRGIANQQRVARDNLAKELLEQGKTPEEVADSLSITPSYVMELRRGVPEGTHDIHLPQSDLDTAMDMFGRGYTRQDVADKLGLSRWHAQSLANQYRARLMDTVTPQQLDDVARALATPGYTFRTADLAWATGLPESTVAFLEQEYANGFLVLRPQSPQAGPSWAASAAPVDRYEWVRPLTPEQQVQAFHELDTGHTPQEIGAELHVPDVAVEQLYAQDDPLVAPLDDPSISSPAEDFAQAPTTFTAQDEAEIRRLSQDSGLSAAFIAGWFNTTEEEIRKVLKRGAGAPPA